MTELVKLLDAVLDITDEASPHLVVHEVLMRLPPGPKREAALHEALRAYIELRIYERQDDGGLVKTGAWKRRG